MWKYVLMILSLLLLSGCISQSQQGYADGNNLRPRRSENKEYTDGYCTGLGDRFKNMGKLPPANSSKTSK